jgi:uncharacterized protein YqeY
VTLQGRIEAAMRDAMRARDQRRTQTLRMAMAAAQNRRIELGRALTDDEVVEVVGRQVKQRRESIEVYRGAGHDDRADEEQAEAQILAEFLPEQLSPGEIEQLVRAAVDETGAQSPADVGRVMGRVAPQTKGRADGRAVSEIVRRVLAERAGSGG